MNLQHTRARRVLGVAMATVLAVVGIGIATPASAATASLTVNGTVLDVNGNPVVGATIHVSGDLSSAPTVLTDENGQFSGTVDYTELYGWVAYEGPGFSEPVDIASLGGATSIDVVVNLPDLAHVIIQGHVYDANGDPAVGIYLDALASGSENVFAETDALGAFSMSIYAVVGDEIYLSGDGFPAQHLTGYADGDVIDLDLYLSGSGEPVTITVHGTLLDFNGAPVEGETLLVQADAPAGGSNEYNVTTDASGEFVQVVDASTTGFVSVTTLDWNYADYVEVAALAGATDAYLTITLPQIVSVTIEGHVVDWQGNPTVGQQVYGGGPGNSVSVFTDENGFYSLTVEAAIGSWVQASTMHSQDFTSFVVESDGQVFVKDFTLSHMVSVTVQGTVTDTLGAPVANQAVDVFGGSSGSTAYTDASGFYSVTTDAAIGGYLSVSFYPYPFGNSWIVEADGQVFTYDAQLTPTIAVSVQGTAKDSYGAPIEGFYVFAFSSYDNAWTTTSADGSYSIPLTAVAGDEISVYTDDPDQEWQTLMADFDGQVLTADWGGEIPVAGPVYSCDVDGDGALDDVATFTYTSSGDTQFEFAVNGESRTVDYGTSTVGGAYCADLVGNGSSAFIVQSSHLELKASTGETVTKNDWWIYDYTADTATVRTFPNGEISGVVFENLDADPGVEMIVERLRESGANTFWILDTPTAEIEKIRVGFGTGGTLEFANIDGVEGIDIVTTKVKPNGTTVTEYYTRASGYGEVLTVKVKANGKAK
jgi:protocatechuate 3,4-dioxygenase beta subunit